MSAFPYEVGDKVRIPEWDDDVFVVITAVGDEWFLGSEAMFGPDREGAVECAWLKTGNWQPYTSSPVRKRWAVQP